MTVKNHREAAGRYSRPITSAITPTNGVLHDKKSFNSIAWLLFSIIRRYTPPIFRNSKLVVASSPIAMSAVEKADPKSRDSKASSVSDLGKSRVDEKVASVDSLVDEEPTPFRWTDWLIGRKGGPVDPDAVATRRSIYDDQALGKHYWPNPDYENLHRFDPDARWTYREEQVCD